LYATALYKLFIIKRNITVALSDGFSHLSQNNAKVRNKVVKV